MDKEIDAKLQDINTDSLLAEIERRKIKRPKMILNFAYGRLQELCEIYLDVISTDKSNSDLENKIYRAAMEMWFGDSVWEYIDNELKKRSKL